MVDKGDLAASWKSREDPFDIIHQSLCRGAIDLEFIQVDSNAIVKIQLAVIEESSRGVRVTIDNANVVNPQTLKPERGEKPCRA
jgi:hypothetical protein